MCWLPANGGEKARVITAGVNVFGGELMSNDLLHPWRFRQMQCFGCGVLFPWCCYEDVNLSKRRWTEMAWESLRGTNSAGQQDRNTSLLAPLVFAIDSPRCSLTLQRFLCVETTAVACKHETAHKAETCTRRRCRRSRRSSSHSLPQTATAFRRKSHSQKPPTGYSTHPTALTRDA